MIAEPVMLVARRRFDVLALAVPLSSSAAISLGSPALEGIRGQVLAFGIVPAGLASGGSELGIPDIEFTKHEYVDQPEPRDFFFLTRKPAPP